MTIRQLINLTRRGHAFTSRHPLSTASPFYSRSETAIMAHALAENLRKHLKRLQEQDPLYGMEMPSSPLTRVTTLRNGLRVATESTLASKTATVGVFVDAGSRYESRESNGTAHFLEHMVFKGTERRSAAELEKEIENVVMGGRLHASTSRERTSYYAKVMEKDVPHTLDLLSDILQNSTFEEEAIIQERDVILREKEEAEGQMEEVIFNHLHSIAFKYSPLGRTVFGPAEIIRTIGREHLQEYKITHYTAPRMVVAASGAVKHEDIVEQVNKLFTKLPTHPTTTSQLVAKQPVPFIGAETRVRDDDIPLAHLVVAYEGASWTDPDSIALMVLQSMLGSWNNKNAGVGKYMGSELAQRVVISGVAESMMTFNTNYKDTGLFGVYAVAKPEYLDDLAHTMMHEITGLRFQVSEAHLIRARNKLKSSLLLHSDRTRPVAEDIGRQLLTYGRRIPYAELFYRIDSVNGGTINRLANRFLFDKYVAISAVGPIKRLPDYNWFHRRTRVRY